LKKSFFIQLFLVVLLTAVLVPSFVAPWLSEKVFAPYKEQLHRYSVSSSLIGIAELINTIEPSKRAALQQQLDNDFPYLIELIDFEPQTFDHEELVMLYRGEIVYQTKTHDLFKLLQSKKELVVIRDPDQASPHNLSPAQRQVMGTLALLQQSLHTQPQQRWSSVIKSKSEYFPYPVSLRSTNNIELSRSERQILADGGILIRLNQHPVKYGSGVDYFYQRVGESDLVISAGPIGPFINNQIDQYRYNNLWLIATIMALILGLWIFPSWRSSVSISDAARHFGNGDLSSRSKKYTASNLNRMTQIFNQMASKIQLLFTSNRVLILTLSKDLRLPISKIKQAVESLVDGSPGQYQDQSQNHGNATELAQQAIDELIQLTSNVLFYAKIQQEPLSLQFENSEISCWLEEQVAMLSQVFSATDLSLVFDKKISSKLQVKFDADNLGRAIRGLLFYLVNTGNHKVAVSCRRLDNNCLIHLKSTLAENSDCDEHSDVDFSHNGDTANLSTARTLDSIDKECEKTDGGDSQIDTLPYLIAVSVIEAHQGKLEVSIDESGYEIVLLTLPVENIPTGTLPTGTLPTDTVQTVTLQETSRYE
jgi:signal transduction histidine kinase